MKDSIIITLFTLLIFGCSEQKSSASEKNLEDFLTRKEIRDLVDITSQNIIKSKVKDSITILIYDRIHEPQNFDSIHKAFNYHTAPNLNNPNPTIDEWNAYDGDRKIWETANLIYLLNEFRLIGNIDGISGTVSTLQSSRHSNSIQWDSLNLPNSDFNSAMVEINKELKKSGKVLVTVDLAVFIIKSDDFQRFNELIKKTKWGKVTTYNITYE